MQNNPMHLDLRALFAPTFTYVSPENAAVFEDVLIGIVDGRDFCADGQVLVTLHRFPFYFHGVRMDPHVTA